MEPSTKKVLLGGGIAIGIAGFLILLTRPALASGSVTPQPPGPGPNPPPPPPPPGGCTTWSQSTSDPDAVTLANNISYSNKPVAWVDGETYGPITINGKQWRFQMQWQTCFDGDGNPYQCKHVTTEVCTS